MELTTIDDLNDDCLKQIFSFLTIGERLIAEGVCKRWRDISTQGWSNVKTLRLKNSAVKKTGTKTILRRCGRFLKNLWIELTKNEEDLHLLQMVSDYCPQLEHIYIGSTGHQVFEYYADQLTNVFTKLQQLQSVGLTPCGQVPPEINDKYLDMLPVQNLQNLQNLFIINCQLSINVSRFINLRRLGLERTVITNEFSRHIEQLEHLESLSITNSHVPEEFLCKIPHLQNLKVLRLKDMKLVYDEHISAIGRNCLKLTRISLHSLKNLTDSCFTDIAQLPNLKILDLIDLPLITDRSITGMHQLHYLGLYKCSQLTIEGVKQLITSSLKLCYVGIWRIRKGNAIIANVNEAILARKVPAQFTLRMKLSGLSMPKNLSPLLILKDFPDGTI